MAKRKSLLPKRIAGVKVPKSVRKGRFGELLASPTGQAVIAEAILAIGAVAGAKKVADSPEARDKLSDMADGLKHAGKKAKRKAAPIDGAVAYALGEAARSFADALHRRHDERAPAPSAEGWTERSAHDGSADSKKKPTSYEAGPL
ncbi:MAG TPA: hypothetical protein VHV27_06925 [Phenylobacterium sp.]|nr:hypothetical protein [Phenylobacterium sp.]